MLDILIQEKLHPGIANAFHTVNRICILMSRNLKKTGHGMLRSMGGWDEGPGDVGILILLIIHCLLFD